MSAPTFGFSAGDFIAVLGLIVKDTRALKDVGGESDEYRSLMQELSLLKRILIQLHAREGTNNVFATDVKRQTDLTLAALSSFLQTISKSDAKLGQQAPSSWYHSAGRKAQWAVACAREVEKLRVKVGTHLNELNLLLQLETKAGVESIVTTVNGVSSAVYTQTDYSRLAPNALQSEFVRYDKCGKQLSSRGEQDELLVLLFQLLRALSKSIRDLLAKATLLLPYILAGMQVLTTTIRREPMVQDAPARQPIIFPYDFRVLILEPGSGTDEIRCRLINVARSWRTRYDALSYTWEHETSRNLITVDGLRANVTKNLHSALMRLRHHSQPRMLWVDALCIDQNNFSAAILARIARWF
ncbi:hypothetical protein VTI74DRAFT_1880 [Chaetomium olivicolor]